MFFVSGVQPDALLAPDCDLGFLRIRIFRERKEDPTGRRPMERSFLTIFPSDFRSPGNLRYLRSLRSLVQRKRCADTLDCADASVYKNYA